MSKQSNTSVATKSFFWSDFLAGGLAGIIAKTVSAPIERVKLLMQTSRQNTQLIVKYTGIVDCFRRCIKEDGVLSMWRGNGVNVIRYFPTQALNFSFKDFYGRLLKAKERSNQGYMFLLTNILAGGMAGSTTTLFVHPLDFARTLLAVDLGRSSQTRRFRGLADCLTKTVQADGLTGLYRGIAISVTSIFVYRGLYFGIYDTGKAFLEQAGWKKSIVVSMIWAQFSVIFAQLIAYPGDTVKRKLMMQSMRKQIQYTGTFDCVRKVYAAEGFGGLWKGSWSNVLRGVGSSLCLVLYDEIKAYLHAAQM